MSSQRRVYKNEVEAQTVRRQYGREWHAPFSASQLPWRSIVRGEIVACFADEKDARGFTAARYKEDGCVEFRTKARPKRVQNGEDNDG